MSFKTPYSNFHELNLDWIMKAIKNMFGGTGGQYLRKKSNTQFDYEWHTITPSEIGAMAEDVTLNSQDISFDRTENYTEPSIGAELKNIENIVQIPTNLNDSVVTFNASDELPFLKCITNIEPVQDLNGYDHPWSAGSGKNLLPLTVANAKAINTAGVWNDNTYTLSGVDYTLNTNNGGNVISITVNGTATSYSLLRLVNTFQNPNQLWLNGAPSTSSSTGWRIQAEGDSTRQDLGEGISLPANYTATRIIIVVPNGSNPTNQVFKPMICLFSEPDKTYVPYSNVCPIIGFSSVNIWVRPTHDTMASPTATIPLGQTVYGGTLNVLTGVLMGNLANIASYNGEELPGEWISSMDVYSPGTTPTTGAQVVYKLSTPFIVQVPAQQVFSLLGTNNVWTDTGNIDITIFKSLKEILNSL